MNLKTCLFSILLLYSITLHAQDKIYRKDGNTIDAKVKTVSDNAVTYKRFHDAGGPEYTIAKKEIAKIIYENGTTDSFEGGDTKEVRKYPGNISNALKYGNNIFSIIAGAYTAQENGNMNDPGLGICYERILDRLGHISIALPALINFTSGKDFDNNGNNFFISTNPGYTGGKKYSSFTFMPGIKFYPGRKDKIVRYAIGVSGFTIFGSEPYIVYDNNTTSQGDYHYVVYGLMITNSVSFSVSKHMCFAIDLNGGVPVSDNRYSTQSVFDVILPRILQFSFKVGYRF